MADPDERLREVSDAPDTPVMGPELVPGRLIGCPAIHRSNRLEARFAEPEREPARAAEQIGDS